MANDYFNTSGAPSPGSTGSSSVIRAEFAAIVAGFDKLPILAGSGGYFVVVNGGATGLTSTNVITASGADISIGGNLSVSGTLTAAGLEGFLPLTGGTLTGALSGTSAAFSGALSAGTAAFSGAVTSASTARFSSAVYGILGSRQGGAYGGAGPISTSDDLVLENTASAGISLLTPNTASCALRFCDPESNVAGGLTYTHSTDTLSFITNATARASINDIGQFLVNGAVYGSIGARVGGAYGGAGPSTSVNDMVIESNTNAGMSILTPGGFTGQIRFGNPANNAEGGIAYNHSTNTLSLISNAGTVFSSTGVGGSTISGTLTTNALTVNTDTATIGGLEIGYRNVPTLASAGTAAAVAVGRMYINTGNITLPNGVFAAGDVFMVYNNTGGDITLTQGSGLTLRLGGTASTGSRTLALRGLASVVYVASNQAIVTGAGVS